MSERTGTTIKCDRWIGGNRPGERYAPCVSEVYESTPELARERATLSGWTRTEDGRDFCFHCSEVRAKRKKPADLVPEGTRVMPVFEAAEAAGWERRDYNEETGAAHFFCCGQEVDVRSIIGIPYFVECKVCKSAIVDVLGPSFGKASVYFVDSDKVDTEDPAHWIVRSENDAATSSATPIRGVHVVARPPLASAATPEDHGRATGGGE